MQEDSFNRGPNGFDPAQDSGDDILAQALGDNSGSAFGQEINLWEEEAPKLRPEPPQQAAEPDKKPVKILEFEHPQFAQQPQYDEPQRTQQPQYAQQPYAQPQFEQPQYAQQPPKSASVKPRKKKTGLIIGVVAGLLVLLGVGGFFLYTKVIQPKMQYDAAASLLADGKYDEARTAFLELGDYQDSATMADEALYRKASATLRAGDYDTAKGIYRSLGSYSDSAAMVKECDYQKADALLASGEFDQAYELFLLLDDYKDSADRLNEVQYQKGMWLLDQKQYGQALIIFSSLGDYKDSAQMQNEVNYRVASDYAQEGYYAEAYSGFGEILDYSDSAERQNDVLYQWLQAEVFDEDRDDLSWELSSVVLTENQYSIVYDALTSLIALHEDRNAKDWYSDDASCYKIIALCDMLPEGYENRDSYSQIFNWIVGPEPFYHMYIDNKSAMTALWDTPLVKNLFRSNNVIVGFLVGNWTTADGTYQFRIDDSYSCYTDLPRMDRPDSAKTYWVDDYVYTWNDSGDNIVAQVYRFELVEQNTIKIYCYDNGQTYTLYRD